MVYVDVKVPESVLKTQPFLEKYNGTLMRISKTKMVNGMNWFTYYELDGAESEKGIPYSFMREWLVARVVRDE